MATEEVHDWSNADIDLSGDLSEIVANAPTAAGGFDGNLYTMTLGDLTFVPDYHETHNATHYLRLNVNAPKKAKKGKLDKTELNAVVNLAKERVAEQDAWNALAVKVPAFSPWAPNGYARMVAQIAAAEKILAAKRAGVTTIVISEDNRKDIEDIKEIYVKGLEFIYVKTINDVIDSIF